MAKIYVRRAVVLLLTITVLSGCGSKSAGDYYKEGIKYATNGSYEDAGEAFAKAIEIKADKAEYYIDYGMSLIMLKEYDDAILNFDKAILDKNNLIVNENNKKAYRGKGIAYYYSHSYDKAVQYFDKALAINELTELNVDILYYKGSALERSGQFEAAITTYTSILDNKSSDAKTYNKRAYAYRMAGNFEMSLADYDKAISLDKDNYDYYFNKFFLLSETEDLEGANNVLTDAAKIKIETEEDKFNLAKIHYYMGDQEEAMIGLNEAFSNGFSEAYYYLGEIYYEKEDYESAVNNYEMYLKDETTSESAVVYNQLGVCLLKLKRKEKALSYIQEGLSLNDTSLQQQLKKNEVVAYENLGDFDEAYKLITEYLKLYPEDEDAKTEYEFIKTRVSEVSTNQ
ncbi:MAG: repeat-containing protein [Anaerocolumna sp.]|nr:repeat-containing protein [Anaerocolumna sp.]